MIGGVGSASMQNVTVKNSRLANCKDGNGYGRLNVGGLAGTVTGSLNGFNILSKGNIIGYLMLQGPRMIQAKLIMQLHLHRLRTVVPAIFFLLLSNTIW